MQDLTDDELAEQARAKEEEAQLAAMLEGPRWAREGSAVLVACVPLAPRDERSRCQVTLSLERVDGGEVRRLINEVVTDNFVDELRDPSVAGAMGGP
ncbi:MAG: hypothetical protein ACOZQL_32490 [Myxococcota bacterium]